jgi:GNAT superfamily N-acetyltransferase
MVSEYSVQAARSHDLLAVARLIERTPDLSVGDLSARQRATWARMLLTDDLSVYLAWHGDDAVGTTALLVMPHITYACRPTAFIESMYVRDDHRRRGVARRMVERLLVDAGNAGMPQGAAADPQAPRRRRGTRVLPFAGIRGRGGGLPDVPRRGRRLATGCLGIRSDPLRYIPYEQHPWPGSNATYRRQMDALDGTDVGGRVSSATDVRAGFGESLMPRRVLSSPGSARAGPAEQDRGGQPASAESFRGWGSIRRHTTGAYPRAERYWAALIFRPQHRVWPTTLAARHVRPGTYRPAPRRLSARPTEARRGVRPLATRCAPTSRD